MQIKFKKLKKDAVAPVQGTTGSAGFDLTAVSKVRISTESLIPNKGSNLFKYGTGIGVEIPDGYVGLVFPRSSVYKTGARLTNCVGVIDSDYRGEISAVFSEVFCPGYKIGERCAQLVIVPAPKVEYVEVKALSITERGQGGYGSTGK